MFAGANSPGDLAVEHIGKERDGSLSSGEGVGRPATRVQW